MWKCSIPEHWKIQNRHCLVDLPLNITGARTDVCDLKGEMKPDSCLSFQTAELTDDLPVWLASLLNSSFQLQLITCIQWRESYRSWTGRAVSRVNLKLTGAQNMCNICSTDQFFFREWTQPDLKAQTENNIEVELNKQSQKNNYYGFLEGINEYCIGCQKRHDLTRTLRNKSCSPFLWFQMPHVSLHSLEM